MAEIDMHDAPQELRQRVLDILSEFNPKQDDIEKVTDEILAAVAEDDMMEEDGGEEPGVA